MCTPCLDPATRLKLNCSAVPLFVTAIVACCDCVRNLRPRLRDGRQPHAGEELR